MTDDDNWWEIKTMVVQIAEIGYSFMHFRNGNGFKQCYGALFKKCKYKSYGSRVLHMVSFRFILV